MITIIIIIIINVIIILYVSFRSITMKNLEIVASKLTKLGPFNQISSNCVYMYSHDFNSKIEYALVNAYNKITNLLRYREANLTIATDN